MRILIIEDEHKIADSLKQGLKQEGFVVDIAYDGEYGYDLALTEDFDLIILDLMLPKIPGEEICKNLRKHGNQIPIIMLTAKGNLGARVTGLNLGADDYLIKPFAFEELLARVRALLRRPKEIKPEVLECADLQLDTKTFQVTRNSKDIYLSKREFSLLQLLMRNKGALLSKPKIIERIWSYEANVLPNTVEVYIGYLRNKIEKPFKDKPKLIKTVRGFGYKIEEPETKNNHV